MKATTYRAAVQRFRAVGCRLLAVVSCLIRWRLISTVKWTLRCVECHTEILMAKSKLAPGHIPWDKRQPTNPPHRAPREPAMLQTDGRLARSAGHHFVGAAGDA